MARARKQKTIDEIVDSIENLRTYLVNNHLSKDEINDINLEIANYKTMYFNRTKRDYDESS